jgi:hypothetical protein
MRKTKATDSLEAANALLENGRYDACASRAYYAVYQALWDCLDQLKLPPNKARDGAPWWSHDVLPSVAVDSLGFTEDEQDYVEVLYSRRISADYSSVHVSPFEAAHSCELATELLGKFLK